MAGVLTYQYHNANNLAVFRENKLELKVDSITPVSRLPRVYPLNATLILIHPCRHFPYVHYAYLTLCSCSAKCELLRRRSSNRLAKFSPDEFHNLLEAGGGKIQHNDNVCVASTAIEEEVIGFSFCCVVGARTEGEGSVATPHPPLLDLCRASSVL